jgi:hypothetical protein
MHAGLFGEQAGVKLDPASSAWLERARAHVATLPPQVKTPQK